MRLIATMVLLFGFANILPSAAFAKNDTSVEFVRVWPQWKDADSFKRISEYFTGEENPGRDTILRSQADNRNGFYFLIRARNPATTFPGAKFILSIISPDSANPKVYEFPVTVEHGSHVYHLGLTGDDWAGPEVHPVAWQLRLVDGQNRELATRQSFLWALPESS